MQSTTDITTLFLEFGEVLLTNGWGYESRQLAAEKFNLDYNYFDTRQAIKPDMNIYKLAFDIAQEQPVEVICIDDVSVFITVAESLGIKRICHINYETTCKKLQSFGFETIV